MNGDTSIFGTVVSILLPWVLGGVWVYYLLGRTKHWNWWLVLGHGYIIGLFLTTLVLRAWSVTGASLSFPATTVSLLVLTVAGAFVALKLSPSSPRVKDRSSRSSGEWVFSGVLLLLLTWRYSTILQEVLLRPLFPWDAWMNWAPKAVVWFHFKELVDYVHPQVWLSAPASALNYTLGAYNAWEYPDGIPLVQFWSMLAVDSGDATVIYLPWVFIAIAMGCALYGHLRLSGIPRYIAMTGVYLLLSMPFVNVHSALAGYADLWVAVVFGCSVFAVITWDEMRQWPYAVLAVTLAAFCIQLKIPGLIMAGIAMGFLALSLPNLNKQWLALMMGVASVIALAVFFIGLEFTVPGIGSVTISKSLIVLPYIGDFPLEYQPVHEAMTNTTFLMINWNMGWYLLILVFVAVLLKPRLLKDNLLAMTGLLVTIAFVVFVYYLTKRAEFAQDYTQVNRAIIYSTPLLMLLVTRIFSQQIHPADNRAIPVAHHQADR